MRRSKFSKCLWYYDGSKYGLSIDLCRWTLGTMKIGKYWEVHFLCFTLERTD